MDLEYLKPELFKSPGINGFLYKETNNLTALQAEYIYIYLYNNKKKKDDLVDHPDPSLGSHSHHVKQENIYIINIWDHYQETKDFIRKYVTEVNMKNYISN